MSDEAAALLEPVSVCIASARKAAIGPGSQVLITGAGPIGLILVQVARAFGASEVVVSDPVPQRREMALSRGATRVVDPMAEELADLGLDVDAFLDAAGVTAAVTAGLANVGPGGRVVLIGMGDDTIPLPVGLVQSRELVVTGVFRYTDTGPGDRPRRAGCRGARLLGHVSVPALAGRGCIEGCDGRGAPEDRRPGGRVGNGCHGCDHHRRGGPGVPGHPQEFRRGSGAQGHHPVPAPGHRDRAGRRERRRQVDADEDRSAGSTAPTPGPSLVEGTAPASGNTRDAAPSTASPSCRRSSRPSRT